MRRKALALACLLPLVSASAAMAAISGPFTTSTPVSATLTDWSNTLLFPKFDPSLGTLVSVQLNLSSTLETTLTVHNTSLDPSSGTAKTEVQVTVQDAGSNLIVPELDFLSPGFGYSLAGGDSATSGLLSNSGSDPETYTLGAILAEFTGAGNISLNASTFTQTVTANTGGNTTSSQVTDASLTGTVVYTYDFVPEPASLSLLGVGALLLVAKRRAVR